MSNCSVAQLYPFHKPTLVPACPEEVPHAL
jgi:hypothetical protein